VDLVVHLPDVRPVPLRGQVVLIILSFSPSSSVSVVVVVLRCRRGSLPLGIVGFLSPSLWNVAAVGIIAAVGVRGLLWLVGRLVDLDIELGTLLSVFGRLPEDECTTGSLLGSSSRGICGCRS
jgi:hypothetical protein